MYSQQYKNMGTLQCCHLDLHWTTQCLTLGMRCSYVVLTEALNLLVLERESRKKKKREKRSDMGINQTKKETNPYVLTTNLNLI